MSKVNAEGHKNNQIVPQKPAYIPTELCAPKVEVGCSNHLGCASPLNDIVHIPAVDAVFLTVAGDGADLPVLGLVPRETGWGRAGRLALSLSGRGTPPRATTRRAPTPPSRQPRVGAPAVRRPSRARLSGRPTSARSPRRDRTRGRSPPGPGRGAEPHRARTRRGRSGAPPPRRRHRRRPRSAVALRAWRPSRVRRPPSGIRRHPAPPRSAGRAGSPLRQARCPARVRSTGTPG